MKTLLYRMKLSTSCQCSILLWTNIEYSLAFDWSFMATMFFFKKAEIFNTIMPNLQMLINKKKHTEIRNETKIVNSNFLFFDTKLFAVLPLCKEITIL